MPTFLDVAGTASRSGTGLSGAADEVQRSGWVMDRNSAYARLLFWQNKLAGTILTANLLAFFSATGNNCRHRSGDFLPCSRHPPASTDSVAMLFRRFLCRVVMGCVGFSFALLTAAAATPDSQQTYQDHVRPFLNRHCFGCHGPRDAKAGLTLHDLGTDFAAGNNADLWN